MNFENKKSGRPGRRLQTDAPMSGDDSGQNSHDYLVGGAVESAPELDEEEMTMLGRVKVDLDTPIEKFFSWSMWGFLIGCLVCAKIGFLGGKNSPPDPSFLTVLPYCFGLALLSFALRRGTDNYYLLDVRNRQVLYHFRFLFWEYVDPAFAFDDIRKLEMIIVTRHSKSSTWEEHQLLIHRSVGQIVEFSDWEKERNSIQTRGEKLARLFRKPLLIADESQGSVKKRSDGSTVWFNLGGMAVTEHVLAVSLGVLFFLFLSLILFGVFH